jgi:hypothetical protein
MSYLTADFYTHKKLNKKFLIMKKLDFLVYYVHANL